MSVELTNRFKAIKTLDGLYLFRDELLQLIEKYEFHDDHNRFLSTLNTLHDVRFYKERVEAMIKALEGKEVFLPDLAKDGFLKTQNETV